MQAPHIQPGPVFTREEALAAGYSADAIRHRIDRGIWLRLRHGVFVEGSVWAALAADLARQLALKVAAVQRNLSIPTWAAGLAAATLHGADVLARPSLLRLVTDDSGGRRSGPGYSVVPVILAPHHRALVDGIALTSPARTLVDVARTLTSREAIVVADSMLRITDLRPADITRVLSDLWCAAGIDKAVRIVELADGRAESPLESVGRLALAGQGLFPDPQVWIYDRAGRRARVDFLFRDEWTIVETDGLAKYSDARALKEEKLRQEWLEQLGFVVVRVTWHEVDGAAVGTAARIRDGFALAAARAGQRRDVHFISTGSSR